MPYYEKPNIMLPVSLHDVRLSQIEIKDDTILFVIQDGIYTIYDGQGKAQIFFPKVDFDFCRVYCTAKDNIRKQWNIHDFAEFMQENRIMIDIIDETYGYNQAKFDCMMIMHEDLFDCRIEIYHFGPMKYTWEE
ncbi:MAG: Fibrillar collagen NC1 domain-containing protein [Oscillospiraceae bacterium]|jgi:hypothetical protein